MVGWRCALTCTPAPAKAGTRRRKHREPGSKEWAQSRSLFTTRYPRGLRVPRARAAAAPVLVLCPPFGRHGGALSSGFHRARLPCRSWTPPALWDRRRDATAAAASGAATSAPRGHRGLLVAREPVYSYTTTMMQPSSLPLWPRSVEWLRAHHGNWLVDEVEHYYYSWKAPEKGGPQLTRLPSVVLPALRLRPSAARAPRGDWPPRIKPVFAHPLAGEGAVDGTGPLVRGEPAGPRHEFRTEVDYPRIVAYVAWFDHTRTSVAWYPGRYEPPNAPVRGPMSVPERPALAPARDVQRRLHLPRRQQRVVDRRQDVRAAQGRARDDRRLPRRPGRHQDLERRPGGGPARSPSRGRACR